MTLKKRPMLLVTAAAKYVIDDEGGLNPLMGPFNRAEATERLNKIIADLVRDHVHFDDNSDLDDYDINLWDVSNPDDWQKVGVDLEVEQTVSVSIA